MQCVAGYTSVKVPTKRVKKVNERGQTEHEAQRDPLKDCRLPLMSTHVVP